MSQKETLKKESAQGVVTRYDKKMQKRREQELKAKREQKISRIVGIAILVVIAVALLSIPVRRYIAKNATYITVGGHDITRVEFDYYYNLTSSEYINTYGTYLSYMGLDTSADFASQSYSTDMSWKDYFDQLAVDSIRQNKALADAAEAAGFTYDPSAEYEEFVKTFKEGAAEAGMSVSKYYKSNFGTYAMASQLKSYIEEGYVASAYYTSVAEEKDPSEAEIQAYYDENKASYDSVDFKLTEIAADVPEAQTTTDADGKETTVEPTEAQIQAAMDAAKEQADAALEEIAEKGEEKTGMLQSAVSSKYREWLFDDARQEGDTTVIEDSDSYKYYVLQFEKRYLDEMLSASIRAIMMTTGSGEDVLTEWKNAGGTEDAFAEMAAKYSEDSYSNTKGGLYEELTASTLDSSLSDWIFAEERKPGDTTTLTESDVVYVLYYVGQGRPEWQVKIAGTLLNEKMDEYLTDLKNACEVFDPKGHLVYLKVQEAADTGSTADDSTGADSANQ